VDDDSSGLIKFLIIGVAAYLGYEYLQSSGLWAQWFGGNTFTTVPTLQTYCTANPNGTAVYNGQTGTCAQWMAAIAAQTAGSTPAATTSTAVVPATPAGLSASDVALANSLAQAAQVQPTATMTGWQWNYVLLHMTPGETNLDSSTVGNEMTAAQYVAARNAAGLSGLGGWVPPSPHSTIPYAWVN
jgi:hypothetical protein